MKSEAIFHAALAIGNLPQRKAFVEGACLDNPDLRAEIELLLRSHDESEDFLEGSLFDSTKTDIDHSEVEEPTGTQIGPYKLLEAIGEGGMGTVYMAEQTEPVKRRVALKLIKTGMDTKQVIARFEAERQTLALMDHPNIAKVLDAGATDSGRPYFVMELVKGVAITKFCDDRHLNPKQRLDLFIQVCNAVQHAHQKGIIHRDLKPSNIMVALYDDKPVPKVIDFGVAKATGEQLTKKTMFTRFGQVLGTLEYMSPEQTQLNQLDVDTRSDIYSLGAILYELLSGSPPFEASTFKTAALDEVFRIIREDEPSKPSTKASTAESLSKIATDRNTQPQKLSTVLQGDLDWIVMKALDKDRARRYETASGFALDIERYLKDEPVSAGPPSAVYRFRKFARRNSGMLLAGSIIAALMVVGTGVSTWQAIRAVKAERLAKSEAERASIAETKANSEAVRANQEANDAKKANEIALAVQEFFNNDILLQASPYNQKHDITLVEVLNLAGEKVGSQFPNQPLVEAEIRKTLNTAYFGLGEREKARIHAEKCKELCETHLGKNHPKTLVAAAAVASIGFTSLGKDVDQDVADLERIVKTCEIELGVKDVRTQSAIFSLALGYVIQGKMELAKKRFQWLVDNSVDPEQTVRALFNVVFICQQQGMVDESIRLSEVALALAKKLGDDHHLVSRARTRLAVFYGHVGEVEKAMPLLQQSWESQREVLGPIHLKTLMTQRFIAIGMMDLSRFEEAEEHYLFVLENLGDLKDAWAIGGGREIELELSENYQRQGRYAEAEVLVHGVLERADLSLDARSGIERHRVVYRAKNHLANMLANAGRHREAISIYNEIIQTRQEKLEQDPKDFFNAQELVNYLNNQAITFRELHDHEHEAESFKRAAKIQRNVSDLTINDLDSYRRIGSLLMEQGNATKVAAYGQPSETVSSLTPTPESLKYLDNALSLYEQAEPILSQALDRDPDNQKTQTLLVRFFENKAEVLQRLKRYDKSAAAMEQCLDVGGRDAADNLKLDIYNCEMLAREGDHRAAASRLAEIVATNDAMDSWMRILVYAVCSHAVLSDESLSEEERNQSSTRFEDLAIASLKEVVSDPDGITADRLESLEHRAEFETLRTRKAFQQLLEKMEFAIAAIGPPKIDQNKIPQHKRRRF